MFNMPLNPTNTCKRTSPHNPLDVPSKRPKPNQPLELAEANRENLNSALSLSRPHVSPTSPIKALEINLYPLRSQPQPTVNPLLNELLIDKLLPYLDPPPDNASPDEYRQELRSMLARFSHRLKSLNTPDKLLIFTSFITSMGELNPYPSKLSLRELASIITQITTLPNSLVDTFQIFIYCKQLVPYVRSPILERHQQLFYFQSILDIVKNISKNINPDDFEDFFTYLQDFTYLKQGKQWGRSHINFIITLTTLPKTSRFNFKKLTEYCTNLFSENLDLDFNQFIIRLASLSPNQYKDFEKFLVSFAEIIPLQDQHTTNIFFNALKNYFISMPDLPKAQEILTKLLDTVHPLYKLNLVIWIDKKIPHKYFPKFYELSLELTKNHKQSDKTVLMMFLMAGYILYADKKIQDKNLPILTNLVKHLKEFTHIADCHKLLEETLHHFLLIPSLKEGDHDLERTNIIQTFNQWRELQQNNLPPDLQLTCLMFLTHSDQENRQNFRNTFIVNREIPEFWQEQKILLTNIQKILRESKIYIIYDHNMAEVVQLAIMQLYDLHCTLTEKFKQSLSAIQRNSPQHYQLLHNSFQENILKNLLKKYTTDTLESLQNTHRNDKIKLILRQNSLSPLSPSREEADAYINRSEKDIYQNSGNSLFEDIYLDRSSLEQLTKDKCLITFDIYDPYHLADPKDRLQNPMLICTIENNHPLFNIDNLGALLKHFIRDDLAPKTRTPYTITDLYVIKNFFTSSSSNSSSNS